MNVSTRRDADYRLQWRRGARGNVHHFPQYRAARPNGWHCGHWHYSPEDAVACAIGKGAPMD